MTSRTVSQIKRMKGTRQRGECLPIQIFQRQNSIGAHSPSTTAESEKKRMAKKGGSLSLSLRKNCHAHLTSVYFKHAENKVTPTLEIQMSPINLFAPISANGGRGGRLEFRSPKKKNVFKV